MCVIGESPRELTAHLRDFLEGELSESIIRDNAETTAHPLVFVFTGMGPQWHAMGSELYQTEPVYQAFVDQADQVFQQIAGWSILSEMQKGESDSRMSETAIAQPANFILQAGLLHLLEHKGVHPDLVVGHSVGEVASAYASGALSLADALLVSFHRSRLQATLAGTGGMLAAGVSSSEMESLLSEFDQVEIAAINSPQSVTVAGCEQQLQTLSERLTEMGAFNRLLTVEVPYHSQKMEPIKAPLLEELASLASADDRHADILDRHGKTDRGPRTDGRVLVEQRSSGRPFW